MNDCGGHIPCTESKPREPQKQPRFIRHGRLEQVRDEITGKYKPSSGHNISHKRQLEGQEASIDLSFQDLEVGYGRECPSALRLSAAEPVNRQRKKHMAPRSPFVSTPPVPGLALHAEESQESHNLLHLPIELLVCIVCHLRHDQLRPAFFTCNRLRQAVNYARSIHFNFNTPHHTRPGTVASHLFRGLQSSPYESSSINAAMAAAKAAEAAGPTRMAIPLAPRQPPRPTDARPQSHDVRKIAGPLFQPPAAPSEVLSDSSCSPPAQRLLNGGGRNSVHAGQYEQATI